MKLLLILFLISSCAPLPEIEFTDQYQGGGVFTENDTVIGNDTLYIWK